MPTRAVEVIEGRAIRAALDVPMMAIGPFSFVTGTVRGIELASVITNGAAESTGSVTATERWTLTETPVAPVSFRRGRDPLDLADVGVVVHLELLTPRCRCRELGQLMPPEGLHYARRHLREVATNTGAETTNYVCPDTGAVWLWHRWRRKRAMEHMELKLWEPMLLTKQRPGPDRATSQPLPSLAELDLIPLDALTGTYRIVAQLSADAESDLERAGIRLTPSAPEPAGEVRELQ